jgi:hypothetical protein
MGHCSYANICEQYDNITTGPEFSATFEAQFADVVGLHDVAATYRWDSEVNHHIPRERENESAVRPTQMTHVAQPDCLTPTPSAG